MSRTHFRLWAFALFGVLTSSALGTAEDIDPRLNKILADWQKRQNAFRSVRCEVRGERKIPKGSFNALSRSGAGPKMRRDDPVPPKDTVGKVSLTLFLDFEKGRHRSTLEELQYDMNHGHSFPVVKESAFDGSVAKGALPREQNRFLGSKAPEFSVASGNMKTEEFRCNFFPIFFGHGRIYTVFDPIIPGNLRSKPDPNYLYIHGTGVHDGRTCLIVRTETLKTATASFEEYWVDTQRESAILRQVSYCNSKPSRDFTIQYGKIADGWLPDRWRYQVYINDSLVFTDTMRVEKSDLDPAVQDSEFQMEIKPGMIVEERTSLATRHPLVTPESKISVYRAKEGGEREELPDPYRRKGDRYQDRIQLKNLRVWAWPVLPVLMIVGFVIWMRRRRRTT